MTRDKLRAIARAEVAADVNVIVERLTEIGAAHMGDFTYTEAKLFHTACDLLGNWADLIAQTDKVQR